MKNTISAMLLFAVLGCMHSISFAAELLDVKPVITGSAVSIEISADIAMTYTYYKVPGQPRAVVDIAEIDPEKVEALIVVNEGVVSSISVDKALISGIVVSRIIFNLVSESDISVSASSDRKLLTVTFDGLTTADSNAEIDLEPKPVMTSEQITTANPPENTTENPPPVASTEESSPELDEAVAKSVPLTTATAPASATPLQLLTDPLVTRIPKLVPVVPISVQTVHPSALTIQGVSSGASYIEILANQPINDYKATRISSPDRLIIDIAGARIKQKPKTILINKFGITNARIGVSPENIRIVLDSGRVGFPAYTITDTGDGLRINFR